ncbi:MAG: UDP-N-acetylmuramate dehydrogenase [Planctomycetes bacterium]|nr:UDP-N-acetylmuramate dehydrogenase [Planctomycetota bacterium]
MRTSAASRYPLSRATTFRIGGPAALAVRPRTSDEVALALHVARTEGWTVRCVGMGSNLLVDDHGVDGLVLLMRGLRRIEFEGASVTCGAGVTNNQVLQATRARGLGGLECLVGYPGTLGGAVRMNAGGAPGYVGARVQWVKGIEPSGRVVYRDARDCGFRYRGSALSDLVVTEVRLLLPPADPEEYALRCASLRDRKKATQPLHLPSAGCVWKNPPGHPAAGRLVEEAGCKGLRAGGAEVSTLHANFIVNRGDATCADVLSLMEEVRSRVADRSGVLLEREVIHWHDAAVAV